MLYNDIEHIKSTLRIPLLEFTGEIRVYSNLTTANIIQKSSLSAFSPFSPYCPSGVIWKQS
jgi:hypothetical protein